MWENCSKQQHIMHFYHLDKYGSVLVFNDTFLNSWTSTNWSIWIIYGIKAVTGSGLWLHSIALVWMMQKLTMCCYSLYCNKRLVMLLKGLCPQGCIFYTDWAHDLIFRELQKGFFQAILLLQGYKKASSSTSAFLYYDCQVLFTFKRVN